MTADVLAITTIPKLIESVTRVTVELSASLQITDAEGAGDNMLTAPLVVVGVDQAEKLATCMAPLRGRVVMVTDDGSSHFMHAVTIGAQMVIPLPAGEPTLRGYLSALARA